VVFFGFWVVALFSYNINSVSLFSIKPIGYSGLLFSIESSKYSSSLFSIESIKYSSSLRFWSIADLE
jgi:hypothetical protein